MRLETEARGGLLSKEDRAFNDARSPSSMIASRPDTKIEARGLLRKMGVTPDSGLASLWLLLLFCEQCSHMEQHPIVVQWNLFTHRTGFDYYCCCSHREEHPSALDHLGRTWVSCAIFHIFSKPSFWLSGLISQGILRFHCSVCIWYRVIDYF